MAKLDDILLDIKNQLGPELIFTDVVGMDGLSIAGAYADPNFDSSVAAARLAMVVKLSSRVADKLSMGTVEDGLITTDQGNVLVRFLGDHSYYWGIAITADATLGVVRMLMNEYADQIWDAIPH